ncbi:MAG: glycosyltransferase family 4 protein [Patescibacteria group bacterium]
MKLLLFTQKVDNKDHYLSFFHRWIIEFSKQFESVVVICLEEGEHDLPENVKVLSLGKEERQSRLQYLIHFYWYIFYERKHYDVIFSHMNQEYIVLGGLIWKMMRKKITMWRNHHAGSLMTRIAGRLCDKVFYTSKYSYTASFSNSMQMPVGIDMDFYTPPSVEQRHPNSILFFARIAPVKRADVLIEAMQKLDVQGVPAQLAIYGDAEPRHAEYAASLRAKVKEMSLTDKVTFHPGMPSDNTPVIYRMYKIFTNLSPSGMFDKMIFEAAACGALPLSSNENLRGQIDDRLLFKEGSLDDLTLKLKVLLALPDSEVKKLQSQVRDYVSRVHSLRLLSERIKAELACL